MRCTVIEDLNKFMNFNESKKANWYWGRRR